MQPLRLRSIPGVGEKLAAQLQAALGGEEKAVQTLLAAELPQVERALGSRRRALRVIRAARAASHGYSPDEVPATSDAAQLLRESLEAVARHAGSEPGRVYIETLSPAPSRRAAAVAEALAPLRSAARRALRENWPLDRLREALSRLHWPRNCQPQRLRRLILLAEPPGSELRRLQSILPGLRVEKRNEPDPEAEPGDIVYYDPHGLAPPGAPRTETLAPWAVAPEAVMEQLACNQGIIEALLAAHQASPQAVAAAARIEGVDAAALLEAAEKAWRALEAYRHDSLGREYEEAKQRLGMLDRVATDLEVWLNEEAKRRLEERELRLTAAELLKLLDSIAAGEAPVPPQLAEIFEDLALEAENRLAQALGLTPEEAALIQGLVEPRPSLPLELNREALERLRAHLARRTEEARYQGLAALAREAEPMLKLLPAAYRVLRSLDVAQALAAFSRKAGHRDLALEPGTAGVGIERGLELRLLGQPGAQPVSYAVGCTSYRPEGTSCERIVILTGANSGGKTTLLRLVAETVLLGQAGLPVPAEKAWIGPYDKVYFISKPTGMLSAGALETLLKRLAEIVEEAENNRVLVLVDELEAVTEANAAARIVAAFAEELAARPGATAVIVTHMAEEIMGLVSPEARKTIRIDGIEAKGLDENYNLIVDRTPRYRYLARSTPELVVRKLSAKTRRRKEKQFYQHILEKMTA